MQRSLVASMALVLAAQAPVAFSRAPLPFRALAIDALVVEPDGTIIAAGQPAYCRSTGGVSAKPILARFLPTGHLDPAFGRGGVAAFSVQNSFSALAFARRDDGKYWLAFADETNGNLSVQLVDENGSVDASSSPHLIYKPTPGSIKSTSPQMLNVLPQSNGKMLAFGSTYSQFVIVRFGADGGVDPTFGNAGATVVHTDASTSEFTLAGRGLLQDDGKILTSAMHYIITNNMAVITSLLYRFDADGQPDATFGTKGVITLPNFEANPLLPLPGGGEIIRELSQSGTIDDALALGPTGQTVTAFGAGGHVPLPNPDTDNLRMSALTAAKQEDGKIMVLAAASFKVQDQTVGFREIPYLLRLLPDGSLDKTFGYTGAVARNLTTGRTEFATSMAIDAQGRILTAGSPSAACDPDQPFLLSRTLPDGTVDASFGNEGMAVP